MNSPPKDSGSAETLTEKLFALGFHRDEDWFVRDEGGECEELIHIDTLAALAAAHIVQVGEQTCHYKTCIRERCRAEERCLAAPPLEGEGGWISVKDRMPEPDVDCLVWCAERMEIAGLRIRWKGRILWHGQTGSHNQTTHWRPLPAPPEDGASGSEGTS